MVIQSYHLIENMWFYLFVVAVLISLAAFTWQFRDLPGAKPQVYVEVFKGGWLLFLFLAMNSINLLDKVAWLQLQQMMASISPYFWFVFVLEMSNQEKEIPRAVKFAIGVIIGCLWLAIITNSWHGLYWSRIWLDGQVVRVLNGPVNWAARVNSYLLCAMAVGFSLRWVLTSVGLRRRQALWFTVAGLVSLAGAILQFISAALRINPLPLGFLLNGLLVTGGIFTGVGTILFP